MVKLELPLVSIDGNFDPREIMMVQAIMHAPGNQKSDVEWRTNYYSLMEGLRLCQVDPDEWNVDHVKTILAGSAFAPSLEQVITEAIERAERARLSAKALYWHAVYHMYPSVNVKPPKFQMTQEFVRDSPRKGDHQRTGSQRKISRTFQLDSWKRFKPVAHLWCAQIINSVASEERSFPLRSDTFERFLAIADVFGQFGTTFKPFRQKMPLIPKGALWEIPRRMLTDHAREEADAAIRRFFSPNKA